MQSEPCSENEQIFRTYCLIFVRTANTAFSIISAVTVLCWPYNLYAINNSARAETRANRVRTNNIQLLLSDGSDAYSTALFLIIRNTTVRCANKNQ